jgi:PAS domain S-box-containing protein
VSTRARILLVDDRSENLLALEAILEPLGHELVRAQSGEEALRALLRTEFAVVLLDVQMPGMNGFETVELIKQRDRTKDIPIIFLTAISKDDEYVFRGYEVGAVDYMFKPLHPEILRSKVSVFVDLHLKNQRILEQETHLRASRERELEQRYALERLEVEARFTEVIASVTEAIITFDDEQRINLFNAGAEHMFGVTAADALHNSLLPLLDPAARGSFTGLVAQAATPNRTPASRPEIFTAVRADGTQFQFECSLSYLRLSEGGIFTLIGRDITERVAAERALRRQAEQLAQVSEELRATNEHLLERQHDLEEAIGARSRFYASMSHELRTPINAVLGYTSLLLEGVYGELNEQQSDGIERAQRAAKHLLELVNDILDLSKIEAGKFELKTEPVTFPELLDELFVTVRPLAQQNGSELNLENGDHPITIVSDGRRVRQIILNLLSNAIKFGRGKPISVRSAALPDGGVRVDVRDRGEGIAPDDQDRIFDEFVQLGRRRNQEGTGLGLAISQRLAGLLHGTLSVESELGKGSTFTLLLPAELHTYNGEELLGATSGSAGNHHALSAGDLRTVV